MRSFALIIFMIAIYVKSDQLWEMWKKVHGVSQKDKHEHDLRQKIFNEKKDMIMKNNLLYDNNLIKQRLGLNKFSDLTFNEFKAIYLKQVEMPKKKTSLRNQELSIKSSSPVDWRNKNALTPVKNQLECGSCWAFSAIESVESAQFLKNNILPAPLSVQQVVACDTIDSGCGGGNMINAFSQIISAGCLESSEDYPYTSGTGTVAACKFQRSSCTITTNNMNYDTVSASVSAFENMLSQRPFSIGVAANDKWQSQTGGILTLADCPTTPLDHGVQLIGYSDSAWIVRNSWGASWGESGFIRLEKTSSANTCGLLNGMACYPQF